MPGCSPSAFLSGRQAAVDGATSLAAGAGVVAIVTKVGVGIVILAVAVAAIMVWNPLAEETDPEPEAAAVLPLPPPGVPGEEEEPSPAKLREPGPEDVSGTVCDEAGEPIPGARVRPLEIRHDRRARAVLAEETAFTGGAFVIGPVDRENGPGALPGPGGRRLRDYGPGPEPQRWEGLGDGVRGWLRGAQDRAVAITIGIYARQPRGMPLLLYCPWGRVRLESTLKMAFSGSRNRRASRPHSSGS